jgi:hypothetical protein
MIDPGQIREKKIKELTKENEILCEKVDHAQRELAESVRAEIELGVVIDQLRSEIHRLREQRKTDRLESTPDIVLDHSLSKHDNDAE